MSLGEWDYGGLGKVSVWLAQTFFMLCTLFNMIVMFNLLIAIISETFTKVNSFAEEAGMQERASMIAENTYLIPKFIQRKHSPPKSFLFVAFDLDQELTDNKETAEDRINVSFDSLQNLMRGKSEE